MAFEAQNVMTIPAGGHAGLVVYATDDDALGDVKGAAYWSTTTLTGADKDARARLEAFVARNMDGSGGQCPAILMASDGMEMDGMYLDANGRIQMRGGNWNVS